MLKVDCNLSAGSVLTFLTSCTIPCSEGRRTQDKPKDTALVPDSPTLNISSPDTQAKPVTQAKFIQNMNPLLK